MTTAGDVLKAKFVTSPGILRVASDKTNSSSVYLARPDHPMSKVTQSAMKYLMNETWHLITRHSDDRT
jgi:hypothetical protein